jgi:hypothetical protein
MVWGVIIGAAISAIGSGLSYKSRSKKAKQQKKIRLRQLNDARRVSVFRRSQRLEEISFAKEAQTMESIVQDQQLLSRQAGSETTIATGGATLAGLSNTQDRQQAQLRGVQTLKRRELDTAQTNTIYQGELDLNSAETNHQAALLGIDKPNQDAESAAFVSNAAASYIGSL